MNSSSVAIFGWIVTRPTGRRHQSIVVTSTQLLITPELAFLDNEALVRAAKSEEEADFLAHLKTQNWRIKMQRCPLTEIKGLSWSELTGQIRIARADDEVIGAMIPDREVGAQIAEQLKSAIVAHKREAAAKRQ